MALSRMNFPSLYFSLSSYAFSYLQPRISWQQMQWISFTVCSPVIRCRSSLGPRVMFTLKRRYTNLKT
uniref:Uncharacterized protein n=1 Tax=Arundo donax TaxID=35708 RepID=A0A0A9DFH1_ARUDO